MRFKKVKNEIAIESAGVRLLAPTRWTVRVAALPSITDNYSALWKTWKIAKQASTDSEMRSQIGSKPN